MPICLFKEQLVPALHQCHALSLELFQRSMEILDLMEEDLRAAPEHVVPFTSSFLDSCLNL